jgi:hypothetical protein
MSTEDNSSYNDISIFDIDTQRFYSIQFWIFLFLIIPSIICSLFSLYHFLRDRILRQALNNHIIIVLLLINLFYEYTDMSLFIHYFRCFQSFSPTSTFRLIWGYIDWAFYALQLILYDWITIEKHILIFHDHLLSTARKRIFVYYLPPIIITIYCLLYYAMVFFASQCENNFDNLTIPSCFPCAYENNVRNNSSLNTTYSHYSYFECYSSVSCFMAKISCTSTDSLATISKDDNTSVIYFKSLSNFSISLLSYNYSSPMWHAI